MDNRQNENVPVVSTRVPSLTPNPVAVARPAAAVLATSLVGVTNAAGSISPEGKVVAVVRARRRAGQSLTSLKARELTRGSQSPGGKRSNGDQEGRESDHCDSYKTDG